MAVAIASPIRWDRRAAPSPRFWAAAIAGLGLLVLFAYLYLPRAVVVLHPPTQPIEDILDVRADPAAQAVDARGRRVPARVSYVVVDVQEQAATLGRLPDPTARATGTLTLVNRQGGPVAVPVGSLVMSASGVRFATGADATLAETAGATARVPIQALLPGEAGNLGRLDVNRLIGPLAGRVAVLNEEPTVGGGRGSTAVVSTDDVARVKRAAVERARLDALNEFRAATLADELLLVGSLDTSVVEEKLDRKVGDQATGLTYRLKTRVSASRIARADLKQVVRESWRPPVPSGYFLPEPQLEIGTPSVAGSDRGVLALKVPVRTVAALQIDAAAVREVVRGRSADEARRELARTLKLAAEPRVAIQPPWLGRALRVDVAVDLNPPRPGQ